MQAIFVAWYNFARKHETLGGRSPAMVSGLADHVWSVNELPERAAAINLSLEQTMKPSELFAVIVKAIGVAAIVTGIGSVPHAIISAFGFPSAFLLCLLLCIAPAVLIALGYVLLTRTEVIVRIAYPESAAGNAVASPN